MIAYLRNAVDVVRDVIGQSSKTKLLLTVAVLFYIHDAPLTVTDKIQWIVASAGIFVIAHGFAEGMSRKYAPKKDD